MEAKAVIKHIRISPRKLRLVADQVRGKRVDTAMVTLAMLIVKGADIVKKALTSAAANARVKDRTAKDLVIKSITVDAGVTWKRIMPAAMGRANRIRKRTSHLTVVVENKAKAVAVSAEPKAKAASKKAAADKAPAKKAPAKKTAAKSGTAKAAKAKTTETKK